MHENREISCTSWSTDQDRSAKAINRTADMNVQEKSPTATLNRLCLVNGVIRNLLSTQTECPVPWVAQHPVHDPRGKKRNYSQFTRRP
jgi:hypothetical protein